MGLRTLSSKMDLRALNQSRSLCFFSARRKAMPSAGNPGKALAAIFIIRAMSLVEETYQRLRALPELTVLKGAPLSRYTRFGIGGPADLYAETKDADTFIEAMKIARSSGMETVVIGGGTNLIVSDDGFRGLVLKFASDGIQADGAQIHADAGAVLQTLVDYAIDRGLKGL